MNLQSEGASASIKTENSPEISFLDSISTFEVAPGNTPSSADSLQMTLDEIAEQNSSSMESREIPQQILAQVNDSPNLINAHANLENIAQRIFDQDIHDLEFQENDSANSSAPAEPIYSTSSFVEVSHFSFFTATSEAEISEEKVPVEQESVSPSLVEELSFSRAPGLCDDMLIKEIQSIPQRLSFKIGDVAELLGIKPFVLRYWETEFDALKPKKAQNKQRMYTRKQVELAFLVRKLLHRDRYSIEGARNAMKAARQNLKERLNELSNSPAAFSPPSGGGNAVDTARMPKEISSPQRVDSHEIQSPMASYSQVSENASKVPVSGAALNLEADQNLLLKNLDRLRIRVQVLRKVTQEFHDQMNFR